MAMTYPDDADGRALSNLAAQGVDMTRPLLIEFAIDAPDETSARAISNVASENGYEANIYFDAGEPDYNEDTEDEEEFGPSWTVYVKHKVVPSYQNLTRLQETLDQLVKGLGGKVDGWETEL